jgi:calcium-translocating P-type ATPase
LFRDLRCSADGLSGLEAQRRLLVHGPNQLGRHGGRRWPRELADQFTHPLAILLAAAAALAAINRSLPLAVAVAAVIVINAVFAFFQELHAEHAVEALAAYLPTHATVVRDSRRQVIDATTLVPGDVLIIEEGDRISADARLMAGTVEVDMSTLTGESQPVTRSGDTAASSGPLLEAPEMLFSGSACLGGEAQAVVTATGMRTEIGRIAALSQRVGRDTSPLEQQVRSVAKLIAVVAVVAAAAFLPLGAAAGLSLAAAVSFSIGLIVANVPEGLLPTITLALAVGVQDLARRGAVVKRLSAVETLGSTTTICTDKTGTLTQNRMQVVEVWTAAGSVKRGGDGRYHGGPAETGPDHLARLVAAVADRCCTAEASEGSATGDPTEIALLELARSLDADIDPQQRRRSRLVLFRFDPRLRLMTTVDADDSGVWVHTKGAPEAVLARADGVATTAQACRSLTDMDRQRLDGVLAEFGRRGLRVLAVARRQLKPEESPPERDAAEQGLCLIGLVAMVDPPRSEVPEAIGRAHQAGLRIHVVTGDNGETATEIAHQVGIGTGPEGSLTVSGEQLDALSDSELEQLFRSGPEIVFARSSPEAKLRIADALRARGEIVAMTGDGVNDAPALRTADIGVAMGRSGTEVARQAGTMILTDDNFATIVATIEQGRRVYDNVRKFILYIFTHAVPEVAPFLVFALAGGAIPLPLTVMEILAIDLGTDTLPALALSREAAEPGLMDRPPRPPSEHVIQRSLLARAWGFLGVISAVLVLGGYLLTLYAGGWHPHAPTGPGTPLHHLYRQATTVAWLGIVACQVGTAFAARTDHVSLRQVGAFTNRLLLGAIAVALLFAAVIVYAPFAHAIFGTASLTSRQLATVAPFPFVVWGADELRRWRHRRRSPNAGLRP